MVGALTFWVDLNCIKNKKLNQLAVHIVSNTICQAPCKMKALIQKIPTNATVRSEKFWTKF